MFYRYKNSILALQGQKNKSAKGFLMNPQTATNNSWTEVLFTGVPTGYLWTYPTLDQIGDRVLFGRAYMENDQLVMSVLIGRMAGGVAVRDAVEKKWLTDKKSLFGDTGSNVRLSWLHKPGGRSEWISLGPGVLNGSDVYVPYALHAVTYFGMNNSSNGPFNNGVFHSTDSGTTWQMEKISDFDAVGPAVCKTIGFYYYFAGEHPLWASRKPIVGDKWDAPKGITKTFSEAYGGGYVAAAEDDTVHLCWLDRRNNKWRFNLEGPNIENDDIAYCYRKDLNSGWSKDVILSRGLLYSYAPSMSVEGNKVVVAWASVPTAGKQHTENDPNDIYYATSNDGGKTWAKPLEVTDGVKDGITSGKPQVMLLNGVIHLFYIQGKRDLQQISPGLTKLNQSGWPIYYQQRPFPN